MKRTRSDSAAAAIRAAQVASAAPIDPPAHVNLRDGDRPFWDAVICARARDSWNDSDLATAANLARCKADIERVQREIDDEGDTLVNDRGTVVLNPKHSLLEVLSRRAMALSRMLHVHAEATVGKSEDASKSLGAEKKAKAAQSAADDDLIPRLYAAK
jgi:hypothetical protein